MSNPGLMTQMNTAITTPTSTTGSGKKESKLGIEAKKENDMSSWYTQVLLRAEMIDYHDISGCYILRPWSFNIWKEVQAFLGAAFATLQVQDAYFPLFISQQALQKEKDHVEGFAPEVAWVTRSGSTEMAEPIAVRPTSETIMYPAYAKWIQSHRDLPLKLNQWCNVVRWEFKHPQPFLRSREFLWQEGHTAFMTKEEADEEVLQILDFYSKTYQDLLAVPVIKGMKSEKEKFAGALYSTTVESFIPAAGRGIQGATSHCLGQNFSKMFKIQVEGPSGEMEYCWQNSWGFSTRALGIMTLVHGDNNGLVLPPRAAAIQVVIIPVGVTAKTTPQVTENIIKTINTIVDDLKKQGNIRAHADLRDNYTPGWKFNDWELRGVPVRFELGPKELESNKVCAFIRYNGTRRELKLSEQDIVSQTKALLDEIHIGMFNKAKAERDAQFKTVHSWTEFQEALDNKCMVLAPWCESIACEDEIKEKSAKKVLDPVSGEVDQKAPSMGAKSLCIPFEQPQNTDSSTEKEKKNCISCDKAAKRYTLFGRSY